MEPFYSPLTLFCTQIWQYGVILHTTAKVIYSKNFKNSIESFTFSVFGLTAIPYRVFPVQFFHSGKNLLSLQGNPVLIAGTLFSLQGFPCEKNYTEKTLKGMGLQCWSVLSSAVLPKCYIWGGFHIFMGKFLCTHKNDSNKSEKTIHSNFKVYFFAKKNGWSTQKLILYARRPLICTLRSDLMCTL